MIFKDFVDEWTVYLLGMQLSYIRPAYVQFIYYHKLSKVDIDFFLDLVRTMD